MTSWYGQFLVGLIMNAKQLTTHPPPFFRAVLLPPPPLDPSPFSFYRYDIESLDDRSQEKAAGLEDSRAIIDGTVRARPSSNSNSNSTSNSNSNPNPNPSPNST